MLAKTIKDARQRKGLSQGRLAALAGLSRQYLSAVEKGANVSVDVLQRLAVVLEIDSIPLGSTELRIEKSQEGQRKTSQIRRAIRRATESLADIERMLGGGGVERISRTTELQSESAQAPKFSAKTVLPARGAEPLTLETIVRIVEAENAVLESSPHHALELTRMAIDLAGLLRNSEDPKLLATVLGVAWKEQAYALIRLGRYNETFEALNRAEALFKEANADDERLGDIDYIRAAVLREIRRLPEALANIQKAAAKFAGVGSPRLENARIAEAAIVLNLGRPGEARDIWMELIKSVEERGDTYRLSALCNNLGLCLIQLGKYAEAEQYLGRSLDLAKELKHETIRLDATWNLARLRIAQGDLTTGVVQLRYVEEEWERLGDMIAAASAALERIEVLVGLGKAEDVHASCSELLNRFAREGHMTGAMTALGFLRESAAKGKVTPAIIKQVRTAIQEHAIAEPMS